MYLLFDFIALLSSAVFVIMIVVFIIQKLLKRETALKGKYLVIVFIIYVASLSLAATMTPNSSTETATVEESKSDAIENTTELKAEVTTQRQETTTEKPKKTNPLDDGIKKYKTKKYRYITNSDLETYAPNMKDVKVYTVVNVGELDDGVIKASLNKDKFMFSTFDVGDRFDKYQKLLKEDDKIAILGKIDDLHDYSIMGKSVALKDCYVIAAGEDAKKYDKGKSSKKLSKYFEVTEEVAESSDEVSKEDYKDLCDYLDYEDVLRNPDSYKKKYCTVSGSVDQIIEGLFNTFTIYVEDSDGNKWECLYTYDKGESRVLEGDHVTMYGQCKGTATSTTLLGKQVTLPEVDVKYID